MGKDLIPEFTNCIRDKKGDVWCYDKGDKTVYRLEKPSKRNIPQDILFDLLDAANEKE